MSEENQQEADKTPGIMSWQELITGDIAGSIKFYTELLGYTTEAMEMGEGKSYTMFKTGDRYVGGMREKPEGKGDAPTMWINYITVEDLDATVAKAEALGASLCMPPTEVPGKGRFAGLADPQGAPVAFWEFTGDGDC